MSHEPSNSEANSRVLTPSSQAREPSSGTAALRTARAVWTCLIEPGDRIAGALIAHYGPEEALELVRNKTPAREIAEATGCSTDDVARARERWSARDHHRIIEDALERARRGQVRLLVPEQDGWPKELDDLGPHAPVALWYRGQISALHGAQPRIAIVGARAATAYGEHVAAELASDLAQQGFTIVSGAAYGIDGVAHRAALAASGGTIALLAGGVDRPYPAGHTRLIECISERGFVASELPCGSAPTKWRFLQRNRTIAALAQATVVVEAGWRSGSLNTAGHAAALARPIGAVPGPVTSTASAGCHRLLREFMAHCVTNASDVRELVDCLGETTADVSAAPETVHANPRTDMRARVCDALSTRVWRRVPEIAQRCGMTEIDVAEQLGFLALEQRVRRGEEGWKSSLSAG